MGVLSIYKPPVYKSQIFIAEDTCISTTSTFRKWHKFWLKFFLGWTIKDI